MEDIDAPKISDAVVMLMAFEGSFKTAKQLLLSNGLTEEEFGFAEAFATRNLFSFALNRRWFLEGSFDRVGEKTVEA